MTCSALSRPQDGLYRRLTTSLDHPTSLHAADQLKIGHTCEISHRLSSGIYGKPVPLPI